jgi:UDP-perosamine 4-acetyltransferase
MQSIFILGASGHARMVIEAAHSQANYRVVACLAADSSIGEHLLGIPVHQESESLLKQFAQQQLQGFVAIGDNRLRRRLSEKISNLNISQPTIVSAYSYISPSAKVNSGVVVMPGAIIGANTTIGTGAIINTGCSIDHDGIIEDFVHIAPGCRLAGNVTVGANALLGIGTVVIPQRIIGRAATTGAGSVIIRNVPEGETWVGCPATAIKKST